MAICCRSAHDVRVTGSLLPGLETQAVHAGREDLASLGVHALPLDLSTTNPLPDIESGGASYEAMAGGGYPLTEGGSVYARLWNPTVARFESALAQLEQGDAAVAFSSGMAAVTAAVLASASPTGRSHVLAVRPLYGGTDHLLASGTLPGVEVSYCDPSAIAESVRADTVLVVIETPANPTLDLVDIRAAADQAGDVPLLVDNTFATPVLQNPLTLGAAMSLHSATKYLGGHGDVVAGVIACDEGTARRLRQVRAITGGLLHPLGAYLAHRGLSTLPIRVRAQQATAMEIADWLVTHPAVERIHYPAQDIAHSHQLQRQMRGPGAMIAMSLKGGYQAAQDFTSSVRVFTHAVSLGGVDSLVQHPAALTHRPVAPDARPAANLVRLSIGLESCVDLFDDLDRALRPYPQRGESSAAGARPGARRT